MPGLIRFYAGPLPRHLRARPLLLATLAAGTLSTAVQILLWRLFTEAWPSVLWRDARLAAAVVMGPSVLPPPASFDLGVMTVATVVHFVLSFVYTALVGVLVERRSRRRATVTGAAFGLALYLVNMHGFTLIFPWFAQARDWITVVAHLAFGIIAALVYRAAGRRRVA